MTKGKYLLAALMALALTAGSAVAVFAEPPAPAPAPTATAVPASTKPEATAAPEATAKPETDAQTTPTNAEAAEAAEAAAVAEASETKHTTQASFEAEWRRLMETWENLPKGKKAQLYKAREAVDKADCAFIAKAAELKLLDEKLAERMQQHIKARTASIKERGEIPMFRRGVGQPTVPKNQ